MTIFSTLFFAVIGLYIFELLPSFDEAGDTQLEVYTARILVDRDFAKNY